MPTPFPHQIEGARWLSSQQHALLADEPRVGKTGTAIMAVDDRFEETVLTITTPSGVPVWNRAWGVWSAFDRATQIVDSASFKLDPKKPNVIVPWSLAGKVRSELFKRRWERTLGDEAHKAKNLENGITQAFYGTLIDGGGILNQSTALVGKAKGVWCLTGTPLPHDPADIYPMMRALCPERLQANPAKDWPDVTKYADFRDRYTKWRPKKLSNWRTIIVIMGGKNEAELRERLDGFILRRTQQDVGIRPPIYETLPLAVSPRALRDLEGDLVATEIMTAAKNGDTRSLDMHLGPIRRITGEIKARAVVTAVQEEFDNGLDKIVLAYWHKDVGQILRDGLAAYGVTGIDGSSSPGQREQAEQQFLNDPKTRVFLGQIEAAGEAIDLSSSALLYFVETTFSPRSMKQMSLRVTNHNQQRQPIVRVCVLENSIDEAMQEILLRLWSSIREVLK